MGITLFKVLISYYDEVYIGFTCTNIFPRCDAADVLCEGYNGDVSLPVCVLESLLLVRYVMLVIV